MTVVVLPTVAVTAPAVASAAVANPAVCSTHWGTNAKHSGSIFPVSTPILGARAGRHACYDRLVIDLGRGPRPGFSVRYVARIIADPSGRVLSLRGAGKLLIVVRGAAGRGYRPLAANLVNVSGFAVFRQVRGAGSDENVTSIGLGVRARLAFRVFILAGPGRRSRLIVDVAHPQS
jgi:hypothetical protein